MMKTESEQIRSHADQLFGVLVSSITEVAAGAALI